MIVFRAAKRRVFCSLNYGEERVVTANKHGFPNARRKMQDFFTIEISMSVLLDIDRPGEAVQWENDMLSALALTSM
jgi:hypothetical protein